MKRTVIGYIISGLWTILVCIIIKMNIITISDPMLKQYGTFAVVGLGYLVATYIAARDHRTLTYIIIPASAVFSFLVSITCLNNNYFVVIISLASSFIGFMLSRIMHQ